MNGLWWEVNKTEATRSLEMLVGMVIFAFPYYVYIR